MEELRSQRRECWECQATTDEPIAVTVRTPSEELGRFLLCPECYRAYYLPLTPDGSRMLVLTRGATADSTLPDAVSRADQESAETSSPRYSPLGPDQDAR